MDSDTKLLISCVGENDELYTAEVLLLFKTIKKFGGKLASDSTLIANFVKSIDPAIKQSLEDMGVKVRIISTFDNRNRTSNKIRMLEIDDYDYDVLIALDCDTVVVRDFSNEINPKFFQALPVDMDLLTVEQWQKLFSYFDLHIAPEKFNTVNTRKTIIPYFNSGVLSIPRQYIKQIRNTWDKYFFGLFEYSQKLEELSIYRYFFEELALSLAAEKEKIPSKLLTLGMNFSLQSIDGYFMATQSLRSNLHLGTISPFIVHYHHLYNLDGSLIKTGYKIPDLAIEQVNELIKSEANNNDNNIIAKRVSSESRHKQIHIARNVEVLQKISLAKQKIIDEKDRRIKAMEDQLKRAIKDVELLQNINLEHQKTIEQKDKLIEQLNTELKQAKSDIKYL